MKFVIDIHKDYYLKFSAGEVHAQLKFDPKELDVVVLQVHDYTMDGFMAACQVAQVCRSLGVKDVRLLYPYLPFGRQDRFTAPLHPFSLKIFCDMINTQGFNSVTIADPHSDVSQALINNCLIVTQDQLVSKIIPDDILKNDDMILVSPDAGAYKKISKLGNDIAIGIKKRDPNTGSILKTDVFYDKQFNNRPCLIVDDICDGGRTFVELAKALKLKGAGDLYLYVTHGIFSKGFEELGTYFKHIYTTDSFPNKESELLTIAEVDYEAY